MTMVIVEGYLSIFNPNKMELKFEKSDLVINDKLWKIKESNLLQIDTTQLDFQKYGILQ